MKAARKNTGMARKISKPDRFRRPSSRHAQSPWSRLGSIASAKKMVNTETYMVTTAANPLKKAAWCLDSNLRPTSHAAANAKATNGAENTATMMRTTNTIAITCYTVFMPKRSSKPRDVNALAASIVAEATAGPDEGKNPAAVALGRKGGLKGGKARAAKMTPEERQESARRAAQARWKSQPSE